MKLDLHIHSYYSPDSLSQPKNIIKTAIKNKIDIISITDHNTILGGLSTYQENKKNKTDLLTVIGSEIHTDVGDIIGLFLNSEIKSRKIAEVLDEITDQDGITILPHPFKNHNLEILNKFMNKIEFIELLNSRSPITKDEIIQIHSYNKKELGSSDAHFTFEIGKCYTLLNIPFKPNSNDSLISAIRKYPLKAEGTFSNPFIQKSSQLIKIINQYRKNSSK